MPSPLTPGSWELDPVHSSLRFRVFVAMMGGYVNGRFDELQAVLEIGEDGSVSARGTIPTASADTNNPQRDAHLRSSDFLDADVNPQIEFTARGDLGDGTVVRLQGELAMHGRTNQLPLELRVAGSGQGNDGRARVALEGSGVLNRHDFGIDFAGDALAAEVPYELDVSLLAPQG